MSIRRAAARPLLIAALVAGLAGCGSDQPFDYMKVRGKLTYDDGTPLPASGVVLMFIAQDAPQVAGASPRPARASVDSNGEFTSATSYKSGDGLIPGKHKVSLGYATDSTGKLLVPKEYVDIATTPLIVDTGDGTIEVKVPRP